MGPRQAGVIELMNCGLEPAKSTHPVATTNHTSQSAGVSWVLQAPLCIMANRQKRNPSGFPGLFQGVLCHFCWCVPLSGSQTQLHSRVPWVLEQLRNPGLHSYQPYHLWWWTCAVVFRFPGWVQWQTSGNHFLTWEQFSQLISLVTGTAGCGTN